MEPSDIIETKAFEDNSLFIMARIRNHAGENLQQADLNGVTCQVYDDTDELVNSPTITVAGTVYDALQTTDPRWEADSTGYNFAFMVPAASFPSGGESYLVKFTFDPVGANDDFNFAVRHSTVDLPGQ